MEFEDLFAQVGFATCEFVICNSRYFAPIREKPKNFL